MNKMISLLLLAGLLVLPSASSYAADASATLQKALFEEEANQNFEAAIKAYQQVIQQTDEQRKLAATAVFRLGECYRKLGRTNDAAGQYQRILSEFSEQAILVNLSRQNLAGLGLAAKSTPASVSTNPTSIPGGATEEERELRRIQAMIKDSPDLVNARESQQETPLHKAAAAGHLNVTEFLLRNGADVNASGYQNATPLHWAVLSGQKTMAELLLTNRAAVNARSWAGATPLHLAAMNGYKTIAELLLAHKANIHASLDLAFPANKPSASTALQNALIWGRLGSPTMTGMTPLDLAIMNGHAAMVETLLKNGANPKGNQYQNRKPIHLAAEFANQAIVEMLLPKGADVNTRDRQGWTPLYVAVEAGRPEMVELLLKNKAEVDSKTDQKSTPLHLAARKGQAAMVEALLKCGANPDAKDNTGYSALHMSLAANGVSKEQIVKLLLEKGADINAQAEERKLSPLHFVVMNHNIALAKMLLEYKPNTEIRDSNGDTPLHWTIQSLSNPDNVTMLELLLAAGANPNATMRFGSETPLLFVLGQLNSSSPFPSIKPVVELLLAYKADVNQANNSGLTPLAVIRKSKRPENMQLADELLSMLKKAGAKEAMERINLIEVTRNGKNVLYPFTRHSSNTWDRHTLLEVIARTYGNWTAPPVGLRAVNNTNSNFPDLQHVRITRYNFNTGQTSQIPADVEQILKSKDRAQDVLLEWGDAVEIPEMDHGVSESWRGLSLEQATALSEMLKREVTIVVKGQENRRTLVPFDFRNLPVHLTSRDNSVGKTWDNYIASFWLNAVLDWSELVRTSSDLSRVRVKRVDPATGLQKPLEMNLTKTGTSESWLWLQDGDVIEVPEK